jgi:hypothetical protein
MKTLRKELALPRWLAVIVAAGLTACSQGFFAYQQATGSDVATLRPAPGVKILQIDGGRISPLIPQEFTISGGLRQVGFETPNARLCMTFMARGGQKYLIRAGGADRSSAVTLVNERVGDEVTPEKIERTDGSCPASR